MHTFDYIFRTYAHIIRGNGSKEGVFEVNTAKTKVLTNGAVEIKTKLIAGIA